jgi:histone demethylase JARID1
MREWLPQDLESVRKYQSYSKHPVFSHDELLVSIAQNSPTIDTALW